MRGRPAFPEAGRPAPWTDLSLSSLGSSVSRPQNVLTRLISGGTTCKGNHDLGLVTALSIIASRWPASSPSSSRRMRAHPSSRIPWLIGGATAMGTSIWSMHFVRHDHTFSLPVPIGFYDRHHLPVVGRGDPQCSALALYIVGYGRLEALDSPSGAARHGRRRHSNHALHGSVRRCAMDPASPTVQLNLFASLRHRRGASGTGPADHRLPQEVRSWRDIAMRVGAAMIIRLARVRHALHRHGSGGVRRRRVHCSPTTSCRPRCCPCRRRSTRC